MADNAEIPCDNSAHCECSDCWLGTQEWRDECAYQDFLDDEEAAYAENEAQSERSLRESLDLANSPCDLDRNA